MQDPPERIAIFIRSLYGSGGGGAERMMVNLAEGLADRGHAVDLLLGRAEGPYLEQISGRVRVIDLKVRRAADAIPTLARRPRLWLGLAPLGFGLFAQWALGAVPGLVAYLRRERPAALFSALNYSNIAAILAREIAGVPTRLVISERNTLSEITRQEKRRKTRLLPYLVRRYYPLADRIAAVSSGVAADLAAHLGIPAERIDVTYNPVVDAQVAELAALSVAHPWLDESGPSAAPVFLAAGKLKEQKGFDVLLEAFALVRRQRPARLILLGEGRQRENLEAQRSRLGLEQDVDLPGFATNPFSYMRRASVFVLSSRFEGLPGVLIQAIACGCPSVATDCPSGPREILLDGELGPLVPVGDARALADAMLARLDAPRDSAALRLRAQDFSVEASVDRHLALLLEPRPQPSPLAPSPHS